MSEPELKVGDEFAYNEDFKKKLEENLPDNLKSRLNYEFKVIDINYSNNIVKLRNLFDKKEQTLHRSTLLTNFIKTKSSGNIGGNLRKSKKHRKSKRNVRKNRKSRRNYY